ncbi:MAG: hypothetical protein VKO65_00585 [Cyanobacteriota bacterium]|nr:hypothetical protein [Cyanobacteriota bacterium]
MKPTLTWLLAGGLFLASSPAVLAHGIESSLERLAPLTDERAFRRNQPSGRDLQLESRFSTGVPASDALVRLVPPDGGDGITVGRTDDQGRLTFALPSAARPDWELQVDAGPGHRDYLELPSASAGPQASASRSLPLTRLPAGAAPLSALAVLGLVVAVPRLRRRP